MSRQFGYLTLTSPEFFRQIDTLTCAHCNALILFEPNKVQEGGFCGNCNGVICKQCDAIGTCRPFEKWLDMKEKEGYRNSQLKKLGIV